MKLKGKQWVFLAIGLFSLISCWQSFEVYGYKQFEHWLMSLSLAVMFIVFSVIDIPDKEDERDKLIKYRSNFIAMLSLLIFAIILFISQVIRGGFINQLFSAEQMLIICLSILTISSSVSRLIYSKIM
ncbi:hypothetical protein [Macrococcus brunensis]|uniref:hypothetical protein n=1 Tax=Macrococcus brunensis TaxID=198483 RepID=UPI001EF0490D|nr:hypothetical protein [Macrococcus brunensis]ULG71598.1 hypothetical protein MGG12_09870 [Macrococcus brunensis]